MIGDLRFTIGKWVHNSRRGLRLAGLALLLSTINHQLSTCFAQGSLTPPGPPAATMKSLDQIEARTPISSLPYTITDGGSYYLTGNLTASTDTGIVVAASGVTLDLNGYTIYSAVALAQNGGTAILLNDSITDVTIQNGHIFSGVAHGGLGYSGSGFSDGIAGGAADITIRNVSVSGCLYQGISVGTIYSTALVESCLVQTVGSGGIHAGTVRNSLVRDCGSTGIYAYQVFDSLGESTVTGDGIYAFTVNNCFGISSTGYGIYAVYSTLNCQGSSTSTTGILTSTAENCYGFSGGSGNYGIVAYLSALNCYGDINGNGYGINTSVAENCRGESDASGYGIYADIATGCYGYCQNVGGIAIHAVNASYCVGNNHAGGVALQTTIASGCINVSGTTSTAYKYNMP